MQLLQEVRGILVLGGMRDARAGCPGQNDDADEQRDASVGSKYSGHDCHRVYHTYQDDWSDFENEIRFGRRLTRMPDLRSRRSGIEAPRGRLR